MIYFTTFVFTLLLSHIARAVPASGDVASNQVLFNTGPGSFDIFNVTMSWDAKYDNPDGSTYSVACSDGPNGLASKYPIFGDFPNFPILGGAFDVEWGSPNCGQCWELTDTQTGRGVYFTAIDATETGFSIGAVTFLMLNGGKWSDTLEVEAIKVDSSHCGL